MGLVSLTRLALPKGMTGPVYNLSRRSLRFAFKCNEANATDVLVDATGRIDSSGNTNNLSIANNPGVVAAGKIDGARAFLRASNQYAYKAMQADFQFSTNSSWSIWFWIYPLDFAASSIVLASGATGNEEVLLSNLATTGTMRLESSANGTWSVNIIGSTALTLNAWNLVAITYDHTTGPAPGTRGTFYLYVNGNLEGSDTPDQADTTHSGNLYFARRANGTFPANIRLDEVFCASRLLSQRELLILQQGHRLPVRNFTGVNTIQTIAFSQTPVSGSITFSLGTETTSSITAANLTAANVKTALEALPSVGSGNVLVTGDTSVGFTVQFVNQLVQATFPLLTASHSLLYASTTLNETLGPWLALSLQTAGLAEVHEEYSLYIPLSSTGTLTLSKAGGGSEEVVINGTDNYGTVLSDALLALYGTAVSVVQTTPETYEITFDNWTSTVADLSASGITGAICTKNNEYFVGVTPIERLLVKATGGDFDFCGSIVSYSDNAATLDAIADTTTGKDIGASQSQVGDVRTTDFGWPAPESHPSVELTATNSSLSMNLPLDAVTIS